MDDYENRRHMDNKLEVNLPDPIKIEVKFGLKGDKGEAFVYENFTEEQLEKLKGPKGDTGERGETGPQGVQGIQGPKGDKGDKGDTGEKGETGEKGNPFVYSDFTQEQLESLRGPQGIQGEQGPRGEVGPQGERGIQGVEGPKGERGETGPQGQKGDAGERGPVGPMGPEGPVGPKGEQGAPFRIAKIYNSVSAMQTDYNSLNMGDIVLINTDNVEDEDNAKLYIKNESGYSLLTDLSGARGVQGPEGPQGLKGEQGIPGERGPQGPQGETGAQGAKGEPGLSAYELYKKYYNLPDEFTVEAFVKSLRGAPGSTGAAGQSAYEEWMGRGHMGSFSDFLNFLKGPKGDPFTFSDFTEEQLESLRGPKKEMEKALSLLDGVASAIKKAEIDKEFKNSLMAKAIVEAIGEKQTIPFKEVNESNFQLFVDFIKNNVIVRNPTTEFKGRVFALLKDGHTTVTIKLDDDSIKSGYKLKVVYTKGEESTEIITNNEFTIVDPTDCKYLVFKDTDVVDVEFFTVYLNELEKHDNVTVEMKEETNGSVTITKVIDNNDYDIYDLSNHGMYVTAIEKQFKNQFPTKDYNSTDINFLNERIEINGQIKILKFHKGNVFLEPKVGFKEKSGYGDLYFFKNNLKYISVYSKTETGLFLNVNGQVGIVSNNKLGGKVNANSFISKFSSEDSRFKRYTGITRESLEDWLKANPLETL